jgi:hypothetical protein
MSSVSVALIAQLQNLRRDRLIEPIFEGIETQSAAPPVVIPPIMKTA